jgi:hypothetical protein
MIAKIMQIPNALISEVLGKIENPQHEASKNIPKRHPLSEE